MILAIDSSAGTAVAVTSPEGVRKGGAVTSDRRSHAEAIGPLISRALSTASASPGDITAVVMGVGPGPFTGLRVGIAAAQAFAWARSLPLWAVRSHDAAAQAVTEPVVVVSDARRGEWACTRYLRHPDGGLGVMDGQTVLVPKDDIDQNDSQWNGSRIVWLDEVDPVALVTAALTRQARGESLEPARPIYLREPDVTVSP